MIMNMVNWTPMLLLAGTLIAFTLFISTSERYTK